MWGKQSHVANEGKLKYGLQILAGTLSLALGGATSFGDVASTWAKTTNTSCASHKTDPEELSLAVQCPIIGMFQH